MSDMAFPAHTLACDWPGCDQTAHDGEYSAWESYDSAVMMFADPDNDGEWLHTEDANDYCPKHWHIDDDLDERVPGPDTEPPVSVEEQERFQKVFRKYHDRHAYCDKHWHMEQDGELCVPGPQEES